MSTTIVPSLASYSTYKDNRSSLSVPEQHENMAQSGTIYVGNLSFFTTEEQIYELFSHVGEIKRIIMGLDRNTKTPCGFCFVEYFKHDSALQALRYISGTKLDERVIRADLDPGYADNRQYGRGKSGGQVRDEFREDFDAGRGGWGHMRARQRQQEDLYRTNHKDVPLGMSSNDQYENPRFRDENDN